MNIELNPNQTSIKAGDVSYACATDLTGKENFLTKLANAGGIATLTLPAATTDINCAWVVMSGDTVAAGSAAEVPSTGTQCRLKAYGTGATGDLLILADPTANSGAQAGMVRSFTGSHAPSSSSGTYWVFGQAEESFIDGQFVLARFLPSTKVS